MAGGDEAVRGRYRLEAGLEITADELDDAMATRADEMVVMVVGADPIAQLAGMMAEDVDDPLVAKERERSVDGREPDTTPPCAQAPVELLGGHVVGLLDELAEDRHALGGRPNPVAFEQALGAVVDGLALLASSAS